MKYSYGEATGNILRAQDGFSAFETIKAYFVLTKPRINVLLLFTAYCAMIVAAKGIPSWYETIFGLVGLGLSAGGAAVINMWYDRDIDSIMHRTERRPLPSGVIEPSRALAFGITLGVVSTLLLGITLNWLAASLSATGFLYYGVVYTMLLKRRTPQNIVVGGGAGAFPPLVGWAVVTGHVSVLAILLFAVIFFWTPSHFWGLALYKNEDYTKAGVPMMPVARGAAHTKRLMVAYSVVLLFCSVLPSLWLRAGSLYACLALVLGLLFLSVNIRLLKEPNTEFTWAKRTFIASLLYLPALFTLVVACALI